MLITFETGYEVLTGWLDARRRCFGDILAVAAVSGCVCSTIACPTVLGTVNEDAGSKHDKLSAHRNNWTILFICRKTYKEKHLFICMFLNQNKK